MSTDMNVVHDLASKEYEWGFVTQIEEDRIPKGLNEDVIRLISAQEGRAGVHAGVAAERVSPLDDAWRRRRRSRSGPT